MGETYLDPHTSNVINTKHLQLCTSQCERKSRKAFKSTQEDILKILEETKIPFFFLIA